MFVSVMYSWDYFLVLDRAQPTSKVGPTVAVSCTQSASVQFYYQYMYVGPTHANWWKLVKIKS